MRSARVLAVCLVLFTMVAAGFNGGLAYSIAQKEVAIEPSAAVDPALKELRIPLSFGGIGSVEEDGFAVLSLDGATGYMFQSDAPMLPVFSQMLRFPVNTRIVSVSIEDAGHSRTWTDLKVVPAAQDYPMIDGTVIPAPHMGSVYSAAALFPGKDLEYRVTTGQGDWGGVEAHLFIRVYPVQYNPVTSVIVKLDAGDLVVKYLPPAAVRPMGTRAHYDVLVLHPSGYGNNTQPYIKHKEDMGWTLVNFSLSDIYSSSIFNVTTGRDNAEKVKLFIKAAIESWGINHVLIIGDEDKFPIRRAYIPDIDGSATPSDYYYEDIYIGGTLNLSSWNSDGDGYWAESTGSNKNADNCDMDPDVAVGRWPVGSLTELDNVVAKTISYDENITKPEAYDWFRNVTLVGSDTFTPAQHGDTSGVPEGEYTEDVNTQWLGGFKVSKFYETKGTLNTNNIKASLNRGAGIMGYADHGSIGGVVYGYSNGQWGLLSAGAQTMTNKHMLPLSIMDACQTHQLDSSESIGEYLILNPTGGAIGSIGSTRIAYGARGTAHINWNSGFLDTHIFRAHQNATIMPPLMLNKAKRDYLTEVGLWDYVDFKTLVQYIYLGDPIVFIGGPGIRVETANNPLTLAPNESGKFLVGLNNSGLVADDLVLNITGGNFTYSLSSYSLHMKADSMTYVTVGVTVDADALADTKDNVTIVVTPKSTTIPISTNLTTIVKAVRDVRFGVPAASMKVMPGAQFKVDFSIDNRGNTIENATVSLKGGAGDFTVLINKPGIITKALTKTDGNISAIVPEGTLADTYYLQLTYLTVSGLERTFIIAVEVGEQDGLEAYLLETSKTFDADRIAEYRVFIENLGNHRERFDLSLSVKGPGYVDYISWDLPDDVMLDPYENVTETVQLKAAAHTPAGEFGLGLTVASNIQGGPSKTLDLTATVLPVSSISMLALQRQGDVKQGKTVTFELVVVSSSNFDEQVALAVAGSPTDWTVTKDVNDLAVPAYGSAHFNVTFAVPKKFKAGNYDAEVTAKANASEAEVGLVVTVQKSSAVTLGLDKKDFSGYPGQSTDIKVAVENLGNFEDLLVLSVDQLTVPFECSLTSSTMTLGAWSKIDVIATVSIPDGAQPKDGTLRLRLKSASDPTAVTTETVQLHSLFKADPSLSVHSDKASTDYAGQTGSFTIVLENDGNVDQNVDLANNSTWVLQFPSNMSLGPGESKEIVVTFDIPKDATPGEYNVGLKLNATSGSWDVDHKVTVQKVPAGRSSDKGASILPFIMIIVVLVVLVVVLAVMYALKGRSRRDVPGPDAPAETVKATTAVETKPAVPDGTMKELPPAEPKPPETKPPEPPKTPPAAQEPPKTIGGGPPPKDEPEPMPEMPPASSSEAAKPKSADQAIEDLLKDLD